MSAGLRLARAAAVALLAATLLAATLLALAPAASAEDPGSAGILETSFGLAVPIPVGALVESRDFQGAQVAGTGQELPACAPGQFTLNQTDGWFRFRETQTQNGCGELAYTVALPAGTTSAQVRFRADRTILQPASALSLPTVMDQELRVYGPDGVLAASFPYYEPDAPEHLQSQEFSYPLDLSAGQPNVTVGWRFWDRGQTLGQPAANPLFGQSLSSTVRDAAVDLDGIPMAPDRVTTERLGLQGDSVRFATTVAVRVPDSLGVAGAISIRVRVADNLAFSHAFGPRGEPIDASLVDVADGESQLVVLSGNGTLLHGAGVYRLVFASSAPISPAPLLYPFIALVMAVPAGAGALAWRNTRKFRVQATPEFAHTAVNLERVVLAMLAVYLLLPLGVVLSGRLGLLASWPLEGEAGLVYLLVGLSFVAFLAVGFVGRRQLTTLMLEEAAQKEKARRELERSNRELEEFAYVASHDLQEPLRTVASYTQLLQRRYRGKLDADADEFIDATVEGAARMQALIQDLLAYSRVGSKPEEDVAVDLGAVVEDVRKTLRQAIADADAEVVVTKALPTVVGRPRQFEQLLQNLVGNAVKFRDPARPCRVEVAAEPIPGGWRVTVHDNGIGIDPRHFERIFQIFQRLHGRDEYPGTGIGLAICKRIVELSGGRIGVESTPGEGSTFWFTLPDRRAPPGGATPSPTAPPTAPSSPEGTFPA
jgi:signal transduction histidine kinase